MTPDTLHYLLLASVCIALPGLVLASLLLHRQVQSRWSASLLGGILLVLSGQVLQFFSPVAELPLDEFRGIVVATGELHVAWFAGSLVTAAGLLITTAGALGLALNSQRRS